MKVKKIMKTAFIIIASLVLLAGLAVALFFLTYKATMSFDFSEKTGKVMHGASGYLYGIATDEVPSREVVKSLNITTVSQKVAGGLQHPTGDIDEAYAMLDDAEYLVVYLQDMYDTWYYDHANIMEMRSKGEYDWQNYLDTDFLPKVREKVKELSEKPYADKLVYCIYNECDNAIWFGESKKDDNPDNKYGVWCDYNDIGKANFNSAWKQTYDLVKSIYPDAKIGGPGFCDWNRDKMEHFLKFCVDNNCLPEIMIYHELSEKEAFFFDDHYKDYRKLEKELNIDELPIIITEYGMMSENGYPGAMAQYITQIETCKVYADNAYWRLANNLNDNCADANTPNAQWWLMRWYADMSGETVKGTNKDILSSNFENYYFKYDLDELSFGGFMGIASVSDDGEKIDVVCGAGDRKAKVQLRHLDSTSLYGKEVVVTVEMTPYKGLYGEVFKPLMIREYTVKKLGKSLNVNIGQVDPANAYHITVRESKSDVKIDVKADYYERYEFEDGTLLGNAYLYKSYCPATKSPDSENDLVGGMENEGDGVEIRIKVKENGNYDLSFVYGNSNDGGYLENGRQDPDGRVHTKALLTVDGNEQEIYLPNTIKSEYTSCYELKNVELTKGEHTISVKHIEGTYILDSLVVEKSSADDKYVCKIFKDEGEENSVFLTVAPEDGYYYLFTPVEIYNKTLYLKKGLNYINYSEKIRYTPAPIKQEKELDTVTLSDITLSDGAELKTISIKGEDKQYIGGISYNGGKAEFVYNAEEAGTYCLSLSYSNNDEGGVHDYNVDLIERFVTVSVNGEKVKNQYCRNTYSWETVKDVTLNIELKEGENIITLTNDGAVKFNNHDTFAPYIFGVAVNKYEV